MHAHNHQSDQPPHDDGQDAMNTQQQRNPDGQQPDENTNTAGTALEEREDGSVFVLRPDATRTPEELPRQERRQLPLGEPAASGGEVEPKVYDAEIVDDDGEDGERAPVPVDPPRGVIPKPTIRASAERREVVPAWMRDRQEWRDRVRWAAKHTGHTTAYHAVRTPVYAAKVAAHAPRGAARSIAAAYRWIWDTEGRPLRAAAVTHNDPGEYLKLAQLRDEHVRKRLTVAMLAALALAAVALLVIFSESFWLQALADRKSVV